MPRLIRIRTTPDGPIERLDATAIVNGTLALRRYRDRLSEMQLGDRKVGHKAAQNFVERFVVSLFSTVAHDLDGRLAPHVDGLLAARAELSARYDRILTDFGKGGTAGSVAPELVRKQLIPLLQTLERHLAALEDASRRVDLEERLRGQPASVADVIADSQQPHDWVDVEQTPEPDIGLDRRPTRAGESDPDRGRRRPNEELERLRREEDLLASEDLVLRRRVQRRATALVSRPGARRQFPEGTTISVVRTRAWNTGNEASLRRFEALDRRFLGQGYELKVTLPGGIVFQSDGIALAPDGSYRLLESKEPETSVQPVWGRGYATKTGQAELRTMLRRDARIATVLREYGCEGFVYVTGTKELDAFFAQAITEMRDDGIPGADLLTARGLDGT